MINLADFDSESSAFNYCRRNKGQILEVPAGEYSAESLVFPHDTVMLGGSIDSVIFNGTLVCPNSRGGKISELSIESIDCQNMRSFKFDQVRFFGDTAVQLSGASYYNVFDMCKIESRIGYLTKGLVNANTIINGRSNCSESHVKMNDVCNGWYVRSVFEGNADGAGSIELKGIEHELHACWYERSRNNIWNPATVILDETTENCLINGGRRGYLFSVQDRGFNNDIYPRLKKPNQYK